MKFTRAFFLVFLITKVTADEPRCSKYDFEEKVLEKLVRMEFNEKRYKADLEQIKSDIDQRLEKTESLSSIVNNSMKEFDLKVTETLTSLSNNTSGVLADITHNASATTTALEQKFSSLERRITDTFETKQDTSQSVVFKARLREDIAVSKGQTIMYPVVMLNVGDGYDPLSGIFTAPVNGMYMFDIVLCPNNDKYINVAIVIDGELNTVVTFYGNEGHTCYSANAVSALQTGQKVKVVVKPNTSTGMYLDQDIYRWNTFSGVLVHV